MMRFTPHRALPTQSVVKGIRIRDQPLVAGDPRAAYAALARRLYGPMSGRGEGGILGV